MSTAPSTEANGAPVPFTSPSAHVIDGRRISRSVRERLALDVDDFVSRSGRRPGLATVLVGDDAASEVYVRNKHQACLDTGITPFGHRLHANASSDQVEALIHELNADPRVDGILCQLPVPAPLDGVHLTGLIAPSKDVDGLTEASAGALALGKPGLRPCTPAGVMVLLAESGVTLKGRQAVVVGRSNLFGKPMAQMLLAADATVTVAHRHSEDVPAICRVADVLVVAVGVDRMVKADWVKPGAVVVDVGINRTDDGLHGDVDFDEVAPVASAITPVPGGVGPMTITMLLENTVRAARLHTDAAVSDAV